MRTVDWFALGLAVSAGSIAAYLLFGMLGLFALVSVLAPVGLTAARLGLPRHRRPPRPPDRVPVANPQFPAYRRVEGTLLWGDTSARHYDHMVRPMLQRVLAGVLASRHGVDLDQDPETARRLVGEDLWHLVDPSRPPSDDAGAEGVELREVGRLAHRLETL